jgi:16S rRNA (cytosine1402-N4)-methyltransferase
VVNSYDEGSLRRVFKEYGELGNASRIVSTILSVRSQGKIKTTEELVQAVEKLFPPDKRMQNLAKVFQAIRIEVNDEMGSLYEMLKQSADILLPGGNLVVISYHSLEDRPVKRFMRAGNFDGQVEKDFFGNPQRPFVPKPGMPITPSEEEIKNNSRARSAKLRVAIKNE